MRSERGQFQLYFSLVLGGLGLLWAAGAGACSPATQRARGSEGAQGASDVKNGSKSPSAAGDAGSTEPTSAARRMLLGEPLIAPLDLSIEPVEGGRSVLFVAQSAGERVAWARRYSAVSGAPGRMGPIWKFADEYVISAFESDGWSAAPSTATASNPAVDHGERMTVVTSDGQRLCLSTFRGDAPEPEQRGCAEVSPFAVVPLGERFALIEAIVDRPPAPPTAKKPTGADATSAGSNSKKSAGKTTTSKKEGASGGAKAGAGKPGASKKNGAGSGRKSGSKKSGAKPGSAGKKGRDTKIGKENPKGTPEKGSKEGSAQKASAQKPKAPAHVARKPPRPEVVFVKLRWISRSGEVSADSVATGLRFDRPLEGMTLVDARARPSAVDLVWFEASPKRLTAAPMGSARLAAGSLGLDGIFNPASRVPVLEGDLEYGAITGHHAGRLVGTESMSMFVGLTGRPGGCEAVRVAPSLSLIQPIAPVCAVAPTMLSTQGNIGESELAALSKIAASDPRRTFGQPKIDPGLVAWAGDRAFFLGDGGLRTATRADGVVVDADPPFPARRSRIEWGVFAPDGEGVALAAGQLYRIDARGSLTRIEMPALPAAAAGSAPSPLWTTAAPNSPAVPRAQELARIERRRVARIGSTFWIARGDVMRILPDATVAAALAGRAHPDTTSLVGGRERGLFIELIGGRLYRSALDAGGEVRPLGASIESPVRVGFDAVERARGGAIVAGVSAEDPGKVVALTIDADGRAGQAHSTSLDVLEGDLAVRLIALPGGGALLSDYGRRQVIWLDDDARPIGLAAWPMDTSGAACVDGDAGRLFIPSPKPGEFVRVAELGAKGQCVVGDVAWGADGSLRWFGSVVDGIDAIAEAVVMPGLGPVMRSPAGAEPAGAPGVESAPAAGSASASASVPITASVSVSASAPVPASASASVSASAPIPAPVVEAPSCPPDMVSVAGHFCVDRFESMLVDTTTGEALSPDYPSTPNLLESILADWATGRERTGNALARGFPLPFLPRWQRGQKTQPIAVSRMGVRPSGYVTGLVAEAACAAAGKRLCTVDEFTTACRGEDDTLFPYGDTYIDGVCNVFREDHPAAILHGNASVGHLDPRLNRVRSAGKPLLRTTGATPACRSRWGDDAIYDMVGNIDEWVDEEGGAFAGGFYSRSTRSGCEALITAHPKVYLDYSTGVRCCKDAAGSTP